MENKIINWHRKILVPIIFLFVLLVILLAAPFVYQKLYSGKIYHHVYADGYDLSGMNKDQAASFLNSKFNLIFNKKVLIVANQKNTDTTLSALGLSFNTDEIVNNCYDIGRKRKFFGNLIDSGKTVFKKTTISFSPYVDRSIFDNFTKTAAGILNVDPADASLKIDNGNSVFVESKNGQKVSFDLTDKDIVNIEKEDQPKIDLKVEILEPAIKTSDFDSALKTVSSYLGKALMLKYNGNVFVVSKTMIGSWITINNTGGKFSAGLDDAKISGYLNAIANSVELKRVDQQTNGWSNEVTTQGVNGLYLNKNKILSDIKKVMAGNDSQINITLSMVADPYKPLTFFPPNEPITGQYFGKYLDINLTYQKLCRVNGNNAVDCYTISSGAPASPTPLGSYKIEYKNQRGWSSLFNVWLPWWQEIDGDYGIHGLPELPDGTVEGASDLGTPVSEGCIRLNTSIAEMIYSWTRIGTPVYIHN